MGAISRMASDGTDRATDDYSDQTGYIAGFSGIFFEFG
jgi:hypothetical protein